VQVNKTMMIAVLVVLTVAIIYLLVIVTMWLVQSLPMPRGEPTDWRSRSLQAIRRSLLPRDAEVN